MAFPLFAPRRVPLDAHASGSREFARGREAAALVLWTLGLFLLLGLLSYRGDPGGGGTGPNWVGPVGESVARALVTAIGITAYSMPLELFLLGVPFVRGRPSRFTPVRLAGDLVIVLIGSALVQVGWPTFVAFGTHPAAGVVGELLGEVGRSLFSTIGSFLVGFALLGLVLIGRASFSFIRSMQTLARLGARGAKGTAEGAKSVAEAWRRARELELEARQEQARQAEPHIQLSPSDDATLAMLNDMATPAPSPEPESANERELRALRKEAISELGNEEKPATRARRRKKDETAPSKDIAKADAAPTSDPEPMPENAAQPTEQLPLPTIGELFLDNPEEAKPARARRGKKAGPTIVDTSAALEVAKEDDEAPPPPKKKERAAKVFELPSMDLMVPSRVDPNLAIDKDTLLKNAELLVKTLADYGVSGRVEDILPGPTVTTFEVSPAAGTKVSKVASLADDLALALAKKVRIVAPIPGKNRIGFELPNERRIPVNLRDLVEDRRFQGFDAPLPVVLGRDILGNPVYADLASMPHVIVAGATGAGKSVGLNVMLTSLLYRRSPEELRLLMIDPKVVELAPYDRIPHMLLRVVTDMKQAATALKWAVDEMERRYQLFADAGTKNIGTYNAWVGKVVRGEIKNPFPKTVLAKDVTGMSVEIKPGEGETGEAPLPETLPLIVIVVDEFADLMMQQGKDVEAAVARLAQKARAAGMHVILATQRPSVDVITGMIKANFPTRIAYRVAQKVDSRTILDEQGAEHLLGRGDMLIKLNGTNETKRVQCPMVSEEEVQAITDFLRTQGEPVYDENILKPRDDEEAQEIDDGAEADSMYDEAVRLVAETRRCSTSWLQRKLGLGYNRAARIVEMMERRGLVGPANGAKDREVLFDAL